MLNIKIIQRYRIERNSNIRVDLGSILRGDYGVFSDMHASMRVRASRTRIW